MSEQTQEVHFLRDGHPECDEVRTRTWTATIEVRENRVLTVLDASRSEWDLLRDQTHSAVREASRLGLLVWPNEVHVILWKTTKARGTEKDRTFHVFLDRRGVVRYQ